MSDLQRRANAELISTLKSRQEEIAKLKSEAKDAAGKLLESYADLAGLAQLAPQDQPHHTISKTWCAKNGVDREELRVAEKVAADGHPFSSANLRLVGLVERQQRKEFSSRKESAKKQKSLSYHFRALSAALAERISEGLLEGEVPLYKEWVERLNQVMTALLDAPRKNREVEDEDQEEMFSL